MLRQQLTLLGIASMFCCAGVASAQIEITRSVFSACGGTLTAGPLALSATVGQTMAGRAAAGPMMLDAGFWLPGPAAPPSCPADFNNDGFRNPDDLADFITCFFIDIQFVGSCPEADFNDDGSRDPDDLADFITTFFIGC